MAEELALNAIADHAESVASLLGGQEFDASEYRDVTLEDEDVLMLWTEDGRRAIETAGLDFVNLDIASWFKPF